MEITRINRMKITDILGLTQGERDAVYEAVVELAMALVPSFCH
jgi:hypothetical protein